SITSSSQPVTKEPIVLNTSDNIDKLTHMLDSLTIQEPEPIIDSRINHFLKSIPPKVGHAMSLMKSKHKNIFIYGGYIRDTLNNKRWNDVDLISD
ncbi:MAG TPA: hypothetical protein PLD88_03495, partial [Candidatus Berkiella sp.]|nr:hypothetical protein [Candidatus Berkiella sp.]